MTRMLSGFAWRRRLGRVPAGPEPRFHCNVCLGIAPMPIDAPRQFLDGQMLVLLSSLAAALLVGWLR